MVFTTSPSRTTPKLSRDYDQLLRFEVQPPLSELIQQLQFVLLQSRLVEVFEIPCIVGQVQDVDPTFVILVEFVDVVPQLLLVSV